MSSTKDHIKDTALPALYRAADGVSITGQRKYLRLMRADLALLIAGAIFASITVENPGINRLFLIVSAVLLATGALITFVLSQKTYKKQWYGGRAAAESVKTLAWRYMMRAEPFHEQISTDIIDQKFAESLREVFQESKDLSLTVQGDLAVAPQITNAMRTLRASDLEKRKQIYAIGRIADQRTWYSQKAVRNSRSESRWFWAVGVAQVLALIAAIVMISSSEFPVNPTGVFSTLAASALAWLQVKQHEELAQSYSVAAHELGLIADLSLHADNEKRFSTYVADAEAAISREHTLWLARRDQLLVRNIQT